jgi:MFS transporter, DHA1 family, multidrug resistance protein
MIAFGKDSARMSQGRRNLTILFFTLVVVMMGFGIIIPIMPFYVVSFGAKGSSLGLLMATFATMQFIFAPIWGSLSDRYGRKPILMLGIVGNVVSQTLMGFASGLWMLFAARALAGMLSSATLPTAMAYASDSSSSEGRSGALGLMGAAMGVGMVLGPGLGGLLAGRSLSVPFFAAAILSLIALVLVWILVPESLPKERRVHASTGARVPRLAQMWRALRGPLGYLMLLAFLFSFGLTNFESIFGLYAKERLDYGPQQVGTLMMVIGVVSAVVQGGLTGPTTRRWGEVAVVRVSLLCTSIAFLVMLRVSTFAGVLLAGGFYVVSNAMISPATSSLISKKATTGQGAAMGLNNSFMSLGRIVGPIWAGFVFDINVSLPFFTGALIMLIGFVTSLFWLTDAPPATPEPALAEPEV